MNKLTKQEMFETMELIDYGDYENSLLDFFEELNKLIISVSDEEKQKIIEFLDEQLSSWNNFSFENFEYDNFLYKNIYTLCDETIIEIYETNSDDNIKQITTLTLLPSYTN